MPHDPGQATCRSCHRPILWVTTEAGKNMPLDVPPVRRWVVNEGMGRSVYTYETHWATCPTANQHRKEKVDGKAT